LEINAGLCDKYHINVGDVVRITFGPGYSLAEPAASAQKIQ
jgi:protein involved in polysaccharide export with SLBB domain